MEIENLFLKLELSDIEVKLRELLFSKHPIKIWNEKSFQKVALHRVDSQNLIIETFSFFNAEEIFYISFTLRSMKYYMRVNAETEGAYTKLTPVDFIFRAERRRDVRLLMYPKMQGFLYLKIQEKSSEATNVLSINKIRNQEKKLFEEFNEDLDLMPDLGGVRVLDISKNGLAFVSSNNEFKIIQKTKPKTGHIIIDNVNHKLEEIEQVYDVDYLDTRIEGVGLKKVGIKFKINSKLEELISDYDDNSMVLTSLDEDFVKFINIKQD